MSQQSPEKIQALHVQFQIYGKNAREWIRKCALLLPEIHRERVWEKKGFESIYVYAAKLAGMSRHTVDESLRVLDAIKDKPELIEVAHKRGISIIRPIATIATIETASFWAEKAASMSKSALEMYVHETRHQQQEVKKIRNISSEAIQLLPEVKLTKQITIELESEVVSELEEIRGGSDWNILMKELLQLRKEKLCKQEEDIQENHPTATKTSSRHIPAAIMRYLIERSRGQCEYPGCHHQYKIIHHAQRFALEPIHDPARMVMLCKAHERLAHLGLIEHENSNPQHWKIREQPDKKAETYVIDQIVQKYREPRFDIT